MLALLTPCVEEITFSLFGQWEGGKSLPVPV